MVVPAVGVTGLRLAGINTIGSSNRTSAWRSGASSLTPAHTRSIGDGAAVGVDLEFYFGNDAAHSGQDARPPGGEDRFGDADGQAATVVDFLFAQGVAQRGDQGCGAFEQAMAGRG